MQDMGSVQQVLDNYELVYKILQLCSKQDQHAAYKTCRAMRDVCNLNMKTVFTVIHTDAGSRQIQRSCSLCPRGAYNIRNLHVICQQDPGAGHLKDPASAFAYLEQVFDNHIKEDRDHGIIQLANVRNLNLSLSWDSQTSLQLPRTCMDKLRCLAPSISHVTANGHAFTAWQAASYRAPTKTTSLIVRDITSEHLKRTPIRFSKLVKLEVKFATEVALPPKLTQLTQLRQLHITISRENTGPSYVPQPDTWASIASLTGLTCFQLHVERDYKGEVCFPAATLTGLSQLQELRLRRCHISKPCLLASMPCITQLAFGSGNIQYPDVSTYIHKERHCWPALRSLIVSPEARESEYRALQLPQPRRQLCVEYEARLPRYIADLAPDAHMGFLGLQYLAVAQIRFFGLFGSYAPSALQAMSQQPNKYPVRDLIYCELIQASDVQGLQLSSLKGLMLFSFEPPGTELFQAILRAFPALTHLRLRNRPDHDTVHNITAAGRRLCSVGRNGVGYVYAVVPS